MLRLRALTLAAMAAPLLTGCGPWGPLGILPGGPFLGSAQPSPTDWSFTDAYPLIAVETRGEIYRHTVTVLCASEGGDLYLVARHAPNKTWVQNMLRDPRIRLEIGGELYEARAVRLRDEAGRDAAARGLLRKYIGIEAERARHLDGPPPEGDDRAEVWAFQVLPLEGASS